MRNLFFFDVLLRSPARLLACLARLACFTRFAYFERAVEPSRSGLFTWKSMKKDSPFFLLSSLPVSLFRKEKGGTGAASMELLNSYESTTTY
jgi:hypothetical protein